MQAVGRIINWKFDSFIEVLMKKIIKALLVLSISAVFGVTFSYSQTMGTRIDAEIPFEFAIGNKVFPAGNYRLLLVRGNDAVHAVQIRDERGKLVGNTLAVRNGRARDKAEMVFAVTDEGRQLDRLSTTEFGYIFSRSGGDKRVARAERVSVPASTVGPN